MSGINLTPAMMAAAQGSLQERAQEAGNAKASSHKNGQEKDPALWEVSLKFEAMLMQQMMSAMRKTVPQDGVISSGFANEMYTSMFDQAVAETSSKTGSMGIAESIYRQMSGDNFAKANPISADKDIDELPTRPEE